MAEKIFFQSSLPRSLSTVFQDIMGQNPDFYVTPSSGLFELLYNSRKVYTEAPEFKAEDSKKMKNAFHGFCHDGMFGYFNAITDKKYVIEKSAGYGFHRGFIDGFYENPKIICMVRDLRDILSSFEKMYRKNKHKHNSVLRDNEGRGTTVHKRIDEWVMPTAPVGKALESVFTMIREGYDDKILFIKAEDLSLRPTTEMNRVYEYLGIPHFEHDFDNIASLVKGDQEVYNSDTFGDVYRPKLEMKPSDAKSVLGADVCDWIYNTYKWYFDKFNYKK